MKKIITSTFLSINWRDALHGLYVAVGTAVSAPVLNWAYSLINGKQAVSLDVKSIAVIGFAAGVSYLFKKFVTPSQVITPAQ